MKKVSATLVKVSFLVILTTSFTICIGILILTRIAPDIVISVINTLRPKPTPQQFEMTGIAILGDSQSDEYRADDARGKNFDTVTYNWVEILHRERNIDFGEWGTYPEPRRTGYAYNWARSGATARSMIESGQHIGVAEQIKSGEVNTVVIYIGANDYAPFVTDNGYNAIYEGRLTEAQIIRKRNEIVADIKTAIDVLQAAGEVKIVLVTIPHWSNNFGVALAFPLPEGRRRVLQAVSDTNAEITALASNYSIPVLDPNTFYANLTSDTNGSIYVGDIKLERLLINNDPKNMFLDDGIHPGTVLNALFANELIRVLSTAYGVSITPLSTDEILGIVGLKN